MEKFKIGDKIRLISTTLDKESEFKKGQVFTIVSVNNTNNNDVISINTVNTNPTIWNKIL
jgi:hypothetical protein|tara:strand:- start:1556 stop:1735 length:180 start_codon:yes stop_codon:yes gene_type:complete